MDVTVAICTWNRCELLRQTLARIAGMTAPPGVEWEVLVIDNRCTDATDAVLASFAGRLPLRRGFEPQPGTAHARNRVLAEARGAYILWTDDDVLVDEGWLSAFYEATRRHPEAGVFGGPIAPWFAVDPDPVLLAAFPWLARGFCGLDHGPDEIALAPDQPVYGPSMGFAVEAVRGLRFNTVLGPNQGSTVVGEEPEFIARVRARGWGVVWCPQMRVRHYVEPHRMTLEYLLKYYADRGRTLVRQSGEPLGVELFGAPRWIWRRLLEEFICYTVLRATPFRARALSSLREYSQLCGMLSECRDRAVLKTT